MSALLLCPSGGYSWLPASTPTSRLADRQLVLLADHPGGRVSALPLGGGLAVLEHAVGRQCRFRGPRPGHAAVAGARWQVRFAGQFPMPRGQVSRR